MFSWGIPKVSRDATNCLCSTRGKGWLSSAPAVHHTQCNGGCKEAGALEIGIFERNLGSNDGLQVTLLSNPNWKGTDPPDPSSSQPQSNKP